MVHDMKGRLLWLVTTAIVIQENEGFQQQFLPLPSKSIGNLKRISSYYPNGIRQQGISSSSTICNHRCYRFNDHNNINSKRDLSLYEQQNQNEKEEENNTTEDNSTPSSDTSSTIIGTWPKFDELDRQIARLALPTIANFAINPLIGAVDLFWIGKMGNALTIAGQAAANQIFNSAFFLISYLPSITATLVSTEYAKNDKEGVQDAVCQAIFVGSLLGIIGNIVLLSRPGYVLQSVLSPNAPAVQFAKPYLIIRSFAFVPSLLSNIGYSAYRGILDAVTPLLISLFANLINAILDPILIFRFKMGVSGAAIATLAAEVISSIIFIYALFRKKMIRWSKIFSVPSWSRLAPLIKGGSALFLRNMALNATFLMVTRVTQSIDQTGVAAAAHAMAVQVFYVGGIVLLAMSTVAQTLIPSVLLKKENTEQQGSGSEDGRRQRRKLSGAGGALAAKATANRMMAWGFILGSFLGLFQLFVSPLITKITPIPAVQEAAKIPSYIGSALQIINGLVFIGEGIMIGCGNYLQLALSTVVATIGTIIALRVFPNKYGLTGVWMSFIVFNISRLMGVFIHQKFTSPLARRNIDTYYKDL